MFDKKQFLKLFWPVLIEQILIITIGLVNTMMVSSVGVDAISAVSIVDSVNQMVINLFISFSTGATVVIAQLIGAKDQEKARMTASQAMSVCVFTALLTGLVLIVFGNPIINFLFAEAESIIKVNARIYQIFSGLSYPFLAISTMSSGIMRASGNTKTPMRASILSNIVNLGIGVLCIHIFKLGVTGAGIALLSARISAAAILAAMIFKTDTGIGIKKVSVHIQKVIIWPVLLIGVPACIDGLIFNGGKLLIQSLVTTLGTVSLAANGVSCSVVGLINIPGIAMQILSITIIGQAVGAGMFGKELRKMMKSLVSYAMVLLGIVSLVMLPLLPYFLNLYGSPPEVKSLTMSISYLILIMMPITWPTAFILSSCVRSTGDSLFTTIASILSMWFTRVLGAWVSVNYWGWGLMGVWLAWCLDWVVRSIIFIIRTKTSPYINRRVDENTSVEKSFAH